MTVVVGYKDDKGKVWMGSDLSTLYGLNRLEMNMPKYVKLGNHAVIGSCGLAMTGQYLVKLACDTKPEEWDKKYDFSCLRGIIHFAEVLRSALEDEGYVLTEEPGEPSVIHGSFILATPTGLWLINSDFNVNEIDDFTAVGSGAEFAYGAFFAMNYFKGVSVEGFMAGKNVVKATISAANKYNAGCSGHSEIICVSDLKKDKPNVSRNTGESGKRQGRTSGNSKKGAAKVRNRVQKKRSGRSR